MTKNVTALENRFKTFCAEQGTLSFNHSNINTKHYCSSVSVAWKLVSGQLE